MTREKALDQAVKLLRKAQSDNPNEAAAFAAKAQEILDRYEIEAASLDLEGTESDPINDEPIEDFYKKGSPLDAGSQMTNWKFSLSGVIARNNACRVYGGGGTIAIIGRASDVEKVRYIYAWLCDETERLCNREGKGMGRTWRNNFRYGVVDTIQDKLREEKQELHAAVRQEAQDENALVLVNSAIVRVEQRAVQVEQYVKANYKFTKAHTAARGDLGGRAAGRAAGKEINTGGARRRING